MELDDYSAYKKKFLACLAWLACTLGISVTHAEVQPEARILHVKGSVQISGKPGRTGGTIKPGEYVVTGDDGAALLGLAAGQFVYVYKNTELSVNELQFARSGTERRSAVRLVKGAINSDVHAPKNGTTAHKVITQFGELSAKGTAWRTTVGDNLVVAVFSGTVSYNFTGIGSVSLTPGCVATLSGAPDQPVLNVVNLTTGITMTYAPLVQPQQGVTTTQMLASAASSFAAGWNAFNGTATEADVLALAQTVGVINQELIAHNIPPITSSSSSLFPNGLTLGIQGLSGVASPSNP